MNTSTTLITTKFSRSFGATTLCTTKTYKRHVEDEATRPPQTRQQRQNARIDMSRADHLAQEHRLVHEYNRRYWELLNEQTRKPSFLERAWWVWYHSKTTLALRDVEFLLK